MRLEDFGLVGKIINKNRMNKEEKEILKILNIAVEEDPRVRVAVLGFFIAIVEAIQKDKLSSFLIDMINACDKLKGIDKKEEEKLKKVFIAPNNRTIH